MHPTLHLFGLEAPSYTVMVLAGFLVGLALALARRSRYGLSANDVAGICCLGGAGSFLGGKTFYAVQGFPAFLEEHARTGLSFSTYFAQAGLVFYGGLAGSILCVLLGSRFTRAGLWPTLDCVLPSLPLAHACGRVGCFLAGCCYGLPSEVGFFMSPESGGPYGVRLFPIQLVESACCAGICLLLLRLSRESRPGGFLLGTYLASYGCARFVLECFRGDPVRGFVGPFSVSQWCSIVAISLGAVLLLRAVVGRERGGGQAARGVAER